MRSEVSSSSQLTSTVIVCLRNYIIKLTMRILSLCYAIVLLVECEGFRLGCRQMRSFRGMSSNWSIVTNVKPATFTIDNQRPSSLSSSLIPSSIEAVFANQGPISLASSVTINAFLFAVLQSKLFKVLTPSGFVSAFVLGSGLWFALGWR